MQLAHIPTVKTNDNDDALVDVYDCKGFILKKQAGITNALNGLHRGIFIVAGKKVYKNKD